MCAKCAFCRGAKVVVVVVLSAKQWEGRENGVEAEGIKWCVINKANLSRFCRNKCLERVSFKDSRLVML